MSGTRLTDFSGRQRAGVGVAGHRAQGKGRRRNISGRKIRFSYSHSVWEAESMHLVPQSDSFIFIYCHDNTMPSCQVCVKIRVKTLHWMGVPISMGLFKK